MLRSAASLRFLAALVLCPLFNVAPSPLLAASQEPPGLQLIEVVPFSNLTGQAIDDWIGLGIAESIATALNTQAGIRATRADSPPTAPPSTRSDWIISGSYQRLGQQIQLTGHVTAAGTPTIRHSVTVDGVLADLFTLQDQLLMELRPAFEPTVDPMPVTRAALAPETSLPAPSPGQVAAPSQTRSFVIDGPPAPVAPATINRDANGRATVRAVRLDAPLQLDGVLDEPMYNTVEPLTGFVQQQPNPGAPGSEETEAWIFYDDDAIYVSARLWDSLPEDQWIANEMQRDSSQLISNDGFIAVFDTFYDRRNGFQFRVNPLGGFNGRTSHRRTVLRQP